MVTIFFLFVTTFKKDIICIPGYKFVLRLQKRIIFLYTSYLSDYKQGNISKIRVTKDTKISEQNQKNRACIDNTGINT